MRCFLDLIIHRFPHRAFFFHFFFVRHFGPIDKKESLPTPRTNKVCTPLLSSLLFLLSIIFSLGRRRRRTFHHHLWTTVLRVDCHSRAPRTYKRRRSSHAPFDRERKRKRKRCDRRSSSRLLLRRALCYFFLEEGLRFSSSSIRSPPRKVWL